jgi:hypothetical protein
LSKILSYATSGCRVRLRGLARAKSPLMRSRIRRLRSSSIGIDGTRRVSVRLLTMPCRTSSRLNSMSFSRAAAYFDNARSCTSRQRPVAPRYSGWSSGQVGAASQPGELPSAGRRPGRNSRRSDESRIARLSRRQCRRRGRDDFGGIRQPPSTAIQSAEAPRAARGLPDYR